MPRSPLVVVLALSACGVAEQAGPPPAGPELIAVSGVATTGQVEPGSLDEAFLGIAGRAPSFAGAFLEGQGVVVLVTDTTAIPAVASAFDDAVGRSPEWSDLDPFRNLPLSFRGARRGWAELYRWRRAFDDRMPAAMTYSDIDERSNRIEVGIDDVTATAAV
jgi:hypothetical protein